tara:strand:- start:947 stop:1273 length:327 start_codon:yes stop_codon:yes gene_type:complete
MKTYTSVDHIAIQTENIKSTLSWYLSSFECETLYEDKSWALLKFENINIALVSPNEHPPHIAIKVKNIFEFGKPSTHRDGINYIYKKDDHGNVIELVDDSYQINKEKD